MMTFDEENYLTNCKIVVVDCIYRNSILEVVNYKSIQNQIYEIWIKLVETCMYGSSHIFFFFLKIESSKFATSVKSVSFKIFLYVNHFSRIYKK